MVTGSTLSTFEPDFVYSNFLSTSKKYAYCRLCDNFPCSNYCLSGELSKYDSRLTGIDVHADSAAINVNFWITPETANLDPASRVLVVCDVETPEVNLTIPVPTRLADMALLVARVALPDEDREEIRREIGPFLPFIDELFGGLADIDNGTTLVSVETGQETVLIEKRLGKFLIDVDAEDAKIRVSIPARSLRRLSGEIKYLF